MDIKKYFECDCNSIEHVFRISYFKGEPEEIYFEPHLSSNAGIIKRIIVAIAYIFGHKSVYGDFDSIVLNVPKVQELHKCLGDFLEENENYEKTQQESGSISRDSSSSIDK